MFLTTSNQGRLILLAAILVVALPLYQTGVSIKYKMKIANREKIVSQLTQDLKDTQNLELKLNEEKVAIKEEIDYYQKRVAFLEMAARETVQCSKILFVFTKSTPVDMWLENISLNKEKVILKGTAANNLEVSNFMRNLEKSGKFKAIAFNFTQRKEAGSGKNLTDFEIITSLKN